MSSAAPPHHHRPMSGLALLDPPTHLTLPFTQCALMWDGTADRTDLNLSVSPKGTAQAGHPVALATPMPRQMPPSANARRTPASPSSSAAAHTEASALGGLSPRSSHDASHRAHGQTQEMMPARSILLASSSLNTCFRFFFIAASVDISIACRRRSCAPR